MTTRESQYIFPARGFLKNKFKMNSACCVWMGIILRVLRVKPHAGPVAGSWSLDPRLKQKQKLFMHHFIAFLSSQEKISTLYLNLYFHTCNTSVISSIFQIRSNLVLSLKCRVQTVNISNKRGSCHEGFSPGPTSSGIISIKQQAQKKERVKQA